MTLRCRYRDSFIPLFNRYASVFLSRGMNRIGSVYKKALYRQYTDASYSSEVLKPAWLGFLGPIIRAEVGDVIEVHMKNFATRSYSLHPHGVFYEKNSEGWIHYLSVRSISSISSVHFLLFCLSLGYNSNLESLDTHPINQ